MTLARGLRRCRCDRDTSRTFPRPATVLERESHAQNLGEKRPAHGQSASRTIRNATDRKCGGKAFLVTWQGEVGMGFNRYAGALLASAAGMGISLGVTASFAADMPLKAPPHGRRAFGYARLLRRVVQECVHHAARSLGDEHWPYHANPRWAMRPTFTRARPASSIRSASTAMCGTTSGASRGPQTPQ